MSAMPHFKQRFKTQFRGREVDVDMDLTYTDDGKAVVELFFHSKGPFHNITRQELSYLCREAEKNSRLTNANKNAMI